jgi:hypothetical protein
MLRDAGFSALSETLRGGVTGCQPEATGLLSKCYPSVTIYQPDYLPFSSIVSIASYLFATATKSNKIARQG